jgi:hypothetical protein
METDIDGRAWASGALHGLPSISISMHVHGNRYYMLLVFHGG